MSVLLNCIELFVFLYNMYLENSLLNFEFNKMNYKYTYKYIYKSTSIDILFLVNMINIASFF